MIKALLDTHFLAWIVTSSERLDSYPWLSKYRPWGLSPISLLELQYLAEIGRLKVKNPEFTETLLSDSRFLVDELPLIALIQHSLHLTWTRDPFDRLLCAHSRARRIPLCTVDRDIRANHPFLVDELEH